MYDIIYNFLLDNIFNSSTLSSYHSMIMDVDTNLNVWLSHTTTIILMVLAIWLLFVFVRWLFRLVSGLFLLR